MIAGSAEEFLAAYRKLPDGERKPATMKSALLFSATGFDLEQESAEDNRYMDFDSPVDPEVAHRQHRALAEELRACGLPVITLPGDAELPDGVFGNNAFATIPGRLVIGSMRHDVRKGETKREDVRTLFESVMGYEVVDLSIRDLVAEMTGPLVIDRPRELGFCGMTDRVDRGGLIGMQEALDLSLTYRFDLAPGEYHTNVVLAVLAGRAAVVHPGSIADPSVPAVLDEVYEGAVLEITDDEKLAFVANCIAATPTDVFLSLTALEAMSDRALAFFHDQGFDLHGIDVSEFEKAGGSLRCMVTEIY